MQDCNAKLSDFGLAKYGPRDGQDHVMTRILGTKGYIAPEYIGTGTQPDTKIYEGRGACN